MCRLQRVQNSCGHRNDHVYHQCCWAKKVIEVFALLHITDRYIIAKPTEDPEELKKPHEGVEDLLNGGFHASNEPYCLCADINALESPYGFQCMVEGCGQTN